MGVEENKQVMRNLVATLNAGDVAKLGQFIAPSFVRHDLTNMVPPISGPDEGLDFVTAFLAAFGDHSLEIEDMVAEGDRVVLRVSHTATHKGPFLGYPPTGRALRMAAINVYRIEDGKVAEGWYLQDALAMNRTIGAVRWRGEGD